MLTETFAKPKEHHLMQKEDKYQVMKTYGGVVVSELQTTAALLPVGKTHPPLHTQWTGGWVGCMNRTYSKFEILIVCCHRTFVRTDELYCSLKRI